jgi:hypothetical protein
VVVTASQVDLQACHSRPALRVVCRVGWHAVCVKEGLDHPNARARAKFRSRVQALMTICLVAISRALTDWSFETPEKNRHQAPMPRRALLPDDKTDVQYSCTRAASRESSRHGHDYHLCTMMIRCRPVVLTQHESRLT